MVTEARAASVRAFSREGLLDLVERRPWRGFTLFAALHLALWSLLPIALNPNLPLDMIEALIYGREWQLGYDKHPPLMWWMVEAIHHVIPGDTVFYVVPQILIVVSFALVFATAKRMTTATAALVAVLIADGFHYFGFTAAKFNHNVMQLPFWALAGFAFHGALRERHWRYWLLLGLAFGLALWSKYFAVVLMAPMALFLVATRDGRRALATPGPYLAALVTVLTVAPHLVWLVQHDFLPFGYAEARAAPPQHLVDHLVRPLLFAVGQLGWAIPALVVAVPLLWPRPAVPRAGPEAADRRIAALLALGPFVLLLIGSLLTGRLVVAMWGYPLFLFVGLWLVMAVPAAVDRVRAGRALVAWTVITALYALAFIADYAVLPRFDQRMRAALFPGAQLAHTVAPGFRAATGEPLAYVIGSYWLAGNIGHYAPERPRVIIDGDLARTPWIDPADVRRRGAVIVWDQDPGKIPAEYAALARGAALQAPFTLAPHWGRAASRFGWAIVPPAP